MKKLVVAALLGLSGIVAGHLPTDAAGEARIEMRLTLSQRPTSVLSQRCVDRMVHTTLRNPSGESVTQTAGVKMSDNGSFEGTYGSALLVES